MPTSQQAAVADAGRTEPVPARRVSTHTQPTAGTTNDERLPIATHSHERWARPRDKAGAARPKDATSRADRCDTRGRDPARYAAAAAYATPVAGSAHTSTGSAYGAAAPTGDPARDAREHASATGKSQRCHRAHLASR